jgi:hypothetical protein
MQLKPTKLRWDHGGLSSAGRVGATTTHPRAAVPHRPARAAAASASEPGSGAANERLPRGWGPQPAASSAATAGAAQTASGAPASSSGAARGQAQQPKQQPHEGAPRRKRVIVVGAGWGGFGAALAAAKAGADVTLLDAGDAPGGLSSAFTTAGAGAATGRRAAACPRSRPSWLATGAAWPSPGGARARCSAPRPGKRLQALPKPPGGQGRPLQPALSAAAPPLAPPPRRPRRGARHQGLLALLLQHQGPAAPRAAGRARRRRPADALCTLRLLHARGARGAGAPRLRGRPADALCTLRLLHARGARGAGAPRLRGRPAGRADGSGCKGGRLCCAAPPAAARNGGAARPAQGPPAARGPPGVLGPCPRPAPHPPPPTCARPGGGPRFRRPPAPACAPGHLLSHPLALPPPAARGPAHGAGPFGAAA